MLYTLLQQLARFDTQLHCISTADVLPTSIHLSTATDLLIIIIIIIKNDKLKLKAAKTR